MKRVVPVIIILLIITGCNRKKDDVLVIYSYDSFAWITENLTKTFEQEHNCTIKFVPFENTSKMVTRLILEKSTPNADLAVGFTPSMLIRAKKEGILQPYKSKNIGNISDQKYLLDDEYYTTPYDYGSLAIIYKPHQIQDPPSDFDDLLTYKDSIIIQDPRYSSTGTDFFLWTVAEYGTEWQEFWIAFKECIITTSPGWSESFAAFEGGNASMMVSYATDEAYAVHNYGGSEYKAFIPDNRGYIQIEGASVIKGCSSPSLAREFIDFMLEDRFQKEIPIHQWMFPVTDVELPDVFSHAVIPEKTVTIDTKEIDAHLDEWQIEWERIMTQ